MLLCQAHRCCLSLLSCSLLFCLLLLSLSLHLDNMQEQLSSTLVLERPTSSRAKRAFTVNQTFLVAADMAPKCKDQCELWISQFEGLDAGQIYAEAPLLDVNVVTLQLPLEARCAFQLQVSCPAASGCQALNKVLLETGKLRWQGADAGEADTWHMEHVHLVQQRICIEQKDELVQPVQPSMQAYAHAVPGTRQILVGMVSVAIVGLQGCLLCKSSKR